MIVNIREKKYGSRLALENIRVVFPRGKTSLIIGTSGAGKSTLIKCMIGTNSFDGDITDYRREEIAYIPQHPALNTRETAHDAIYWSALFSRLYQGKAELNRSVDWMVNTLGLQQVQRNEIRRLSGGQMQRVSIAKELVRGTRIIIADEIDTGLDCGVSRDLIGKLCQITHQNNMTTIIISHNIVNIEMYDHVVVLVKSDAGPGKIAYAGPPQFVRRFFEVKNYVDILVKLNRRDEGGMGLADLYINRFDNAMRQQGM